MSNDPQLAYQDGNRRMAAGDIAGAEECFWHALALDPAHAAARANLGYLAEVRGQWLQAEFHYLQALVLLPDHARLYLSFAALLEKMGRDAEAEAAMRSALALAPAAPGAWRQLGSLLVRQGREDEAEQCYRQALATAGCGTAASGTTSGIASDLAADTAPDAAHDGMADAHVARASAQLGELLLGQGRYGEGWPLLAAQAEDDALATTLDCPPWRGEPLHGKAIVVLAGAAAADTIHFSRYLPRLKQAGAKRVALVCPRTLRGLLVTLDGLDEIYAQEVAWPHTGWDYHSHGVCLPQFFGLLSPGAYLSATPEQARYWRGPLAAIDVHAGGGVDAGAGASAHSDAGAEVYAKVYANSAPCLRVGVMWHGATAHAGPTLQELAPLAEVAGVRLVSLHYGEAITPAAGTSYGAAVLDLGLRMQDEADVAGVIANLDLVISVDATVAHVAGALGKSCWLLVPAGRCNWRWTAVHDADRWYPSLRIFRQQQTGDWSGVMAQLAAALDGHRQA